MTPTRLQAAIVIFCLAGLSMCAFHVGRLSSNHPAPLIVESAVGRLEESAVRNGLSVTLFVWPGILLLQSRQCDIHVEVHGDGVMSFKRNEPTCEAAATEVLAALEARNVR